jgi:hypothetical protein
MNFRSNKENLWYEGPTLTEFLARAKRSAQMWSSLESLMEQNYDASQPVIESPNKHKFRKPKRSQ